MCLYRGMAQGRVSDPCIGAVSDLYQLRADYWHETEESQDHHHGGALLLLVGAMLIAWMVSRCCYAQREKKVRSFLTALHTHPNLRASVEAEIGQEVPIPQSHAACCAGTDQEKCCTQNCFLKFVKVTSFFICVLVGSFWVAFTSLEITMHIVNDMDEHAGVDPETGDKHFTSPVAALAILLLVCTAEIAVVALLARGVRACFKGPRSSTPEDPDTTVPEWLRQRIQPISQFFRRSGAGGGGVTDGYTRLPGGDEYAGDNEMLRSHHGAASATEMVSMSARPSYVSPAVATVNATAPPMQAIQQGHHHHHQQQQQQQRYAAMLVPVTAMPVNGGVSMV